MAASQADPIASTPYLTTIHVANIHCSSCESYVKDVLLHVTGVRRVDVSLIDHTITTRHERDNTRTIVDELVSASFEVQHVTMSFHDTTILDYDHKTSTLGTPLSRIFSRKVQRKHLENCLACQTAKSTPRKQPRSWAMLLRANRKTLSTENRAERGENTSSNNLTLPQHVGEDSEKYAIPDVLPSSSLPEEKYIARLAIGGMTCASCSGAITKHVQEVDGVLSVNVNLLGNSATVRYQGSKDEIANIVEAIEEIGYEATIDEIKQQNPVAATEAASRSEMYKALLSINGMTCGSCVGSITQIVQDLPYVTTVGVSLISKSATVEFEGRDRVTGIVEEIEDAGFEAAVVNVEPLVIQNGYGETDRTQERTIQIQVTGIYCEHCPNNITTALQEVFGPDVTITQSATLSTPILTILYKPTPPAMTIRQIISTINGVHQSFSATVYHPPTIEERSRQMRRRDMRSIMWRLLFTAVVAVPTFVIGVAYMSLVGNSNATKRWWKQKMWAGNVTRMDWALLFITTPVMLFGADLFHVRALREIKSLWGRRSRVPILRRFYRFGSMNLLISAGTAVAYFASVVDLALAATSTQCTGESCQSSGSYFDTVTFLTFFILIGRFLEAYSKAKTGDAVAMLTKMRPSEAILVTKNVGDRTATTNSSVLEETRSERSVCSSDVDTITVAKSQFQTVSKYLPNDQVFAGQELDALRRVAVDLLELGDIVLISHGTSPPCDGVIDQEGVFVFDESSLTGESKPVKKSRGDKVFTGSINVSQSSVQVTVTELGGKSMLDQIVAVVREGQGKRAPMERIADVITAYFVPVITLIAIGTWIIWLSLGESGVLPHEWLDVSQGGWPFWSLQFAIAVFVIACPCAASLAAPTALYVGSGIAAKSGVLAHGGGHAFQEASKLQIVVLDKTGTLTEGHMRVTDFDMLNDDKADQSERGLVLTLAKAMEVNTSHPIAKAIVEYCSDKSNDDSLMQIEEEDINEVPGQGMRGTFKIQDTVYEAAIGNDGLLATISQSNDGETNAATCEKLQFLPSENAFLASLLHKYQSRGSSTAIFAIRKVSGKGKESVAPPFRAAATFAIADPIRIEAPAVLQALRADGLQVHMCTGDNPTTAHAIASQLSIPPSWVRAGVLPQGKAAYIHELQTPRDSTRQVVAFVGDGTNDTPALSAADVSIALSSGSDVAITTASFILLNSDLGTILSLIKLARRVFWRVKMNFAWALLYNLCLNPVAAGVFFPIGRGAHGMDHFRLSPVWASAAMAASSVSVVLSSLALRLPEFEWQRIKACVGRK